MLTFTDAARERVFAFIEQGFVDDAALRVAVAGSPLAPLYQISLVEYDERAPDDRVFTAGGFKLLIDGESAERLDGATVDYVERDGEEGFEVRAEEPATNGASAPEGPLAERVQKVIADEINPAIASHGGFITLRDVKDEIVYIEMSGGCQGCGMARVTLSQGVERMLKKAVPELVGVEDVTDHDAGEKPYFAR